MKPSFLGLVLGLSLISYQANSVAIGSKQTAVVAKVPQKIFQCELNQIDCLRQAYTSPSHLWPKATIDEGVKFAELAPLPTVIPQPTAAQAAKISLGKALFFETRLSSDGQVSCATCHLPFQGFAEKRPVSNGVYNRQGRRNAQALLHLGTQQSFFFWDGRATTLEQQALMPLTDPLEMNQDLKKVPQILQHAGYAPQFQQTFGSDINITAVAEALSAYQRTLRPEATRFDAFLLGDAQALSDQEVQGLHLFRTKGRCLNCHSGQMMTDGLLHNLNQTLAGRKWHDLGRYEVTGDEADWGKFKTASLRNLSQTKPWFHHGLFVNLQGVVAMYNIGMPEAVHPDAPPQSRQKHLDPLIQPLGMTPDERRALTAFLESL